MISLFGSGSVTGLLLPLLIFLAEMGVVTCGTLRIIFVSRGRKSLAPLLGFFEVGIWLFAISQIMQNMSDPWCYLAFAGGFTVGSLLGILIEEKLAIGKLVIHIITHKEASPLIERLRMAEYGVTSIQAEGATGPVQIILSVVQRKELGNVVSIIKGFDSRAFYSVDDVQAASEGIFPTSKPRPPALVPIPFRLLGVTKRATVGPRS